MKLYLPKPRAVWIDSLAETIFKIVNSEIISYKIKCFHDDAEALSYIYTKDFYRLRGNWKPLK